MIMYREIDIAKPLYENGFTDGYRWGEALKVAKYMRHVLGYGDAKTKTEIIKFCVEHDPFWRPVPNRMGVKSVVSASRRQFKDTTSRVVITKNEIATIQKVKVFKYQRIMLALLVTAKLNNTEFAWENQRRVVRRIINKYITNDEIKNCFMRYYSVGAVNTYGKYGESHVLYFVSETDDDPAITVNDDSDLYTLMATYESYCGGVIKYCSVCDAEITANSNSHKYCNDCKRKKDLERHTKYNKKRNDQ